eukprot:TRINITY_DN127_c0_g1_i1.p4 TRINITY_DN127_c0_g1~~TRINITY_DN127_c0_g1_i1.p4  ORF type:complete len:196 (-),score=48.44 TRINITY_DN127_c0_g1_i1:1877-2464(-)
MCPRAKSESTIQSKLFHAHFRTSRDFWWHETFMNGVCYSMFLPQNKTLVDLITQDSCYVVEPPNFQVLPACEAATAANWEQMAQVIGEQAGLVFTSQAAQQQPLAASPLLFSQVCTPGQPSPPLLPTTAVPVAPFAANAGCLPEHLLQEIASLKQMVTTLAQQVAHIEEFVQTTTVGSMKAAVTPCCQCRCHCTN